MCASVVCRSNIREMYADCLGDMHLTRHTFPMMFVSVCRLLFYHTLIEYTVLRRESYLINSCR